MTTGQMQALHKLPRLGSVKIVGLIADTHIPTRARNVPKEVFKVFENAEFIVHAGDLVDMSVIDELEQVAPVLAVCGNMDGSEVKKRLPETDFFRVIDRKIGVTHDPGALFGHTKMRQVARQNGFDVLVYGHTHNSHIRWEGNVLFVNPGSPTNPVPPFLVKPSVAFLKITKDKITPEIVQIKSA